MPPLREGRTQQWARGEAEVGSSPACRPPPQTLTWVTAERAQRQGQSHLRTAPGGGEQQEEGQGQQVQGRVQVQRAKRKQDTNSVVPVGTPSL
jgi:hypothetical protein